MSRSAGWRFMIVCLLTFLMFIPLFFVGAVIDARVGYSNDAINEVGGKWGGRQVLSGPYLRVPVEGPVVRTKRREIIDPDTGETRIEEFEVTETSTKLPLYLTPDQFNTTFHTASEIRKRGIFEVPVFTATSDMTFDFVVPDQIDAVPAEDQILWNQSELILGLTNNRALRDEAALERGSTTFSLSPRSDEPGVFAAVGDPRGGGTYTLTLGFNGAERLAIAPIGRQSNITLISDWPHPSFDGAFLPNTSNIQDTGFEATWSIPHLARNIPQVGRDSPEAMTYDSAFGVSFHQPNDFYQKAFRAARYGILFIAMTFLTVFLVENRAKRPVHPVQYLLIGLAQSMFVLLMVAYAEQIGFAPAYLLAACATIALIVLLAVTGLKLGRKSWVLGGMLVVLYAVLYLILRSADYALLAGSTLGFLALAGTVIATRNEDWYGPPRAPGTGFFGRAKPAKIE